MSSLSSSNNFISGGGDGEHAFWAPASYNNKLSSGHNGVWNIVQDPTPLAINTWYHVAVTYDAATTTMKLYKNGVLVSTNNTVPPFSNGNMVRLGAFDNASNLLQGNIDEVRIWNVARTAEQINSSKNCELAGSESGLVTYYKFNQGFDASNNTTITTAVATTGANATLTNFALTGATSNWLAGSPVTTPTAPTAAAQSFCGATTANSLVPAISSTIKWYNSATNTTALTTTDAITTATYYVAAVNANGCESARTSVAVTVNITPAPTVLPVTNFRVSTQGGCDNVNGVFNYIGLLNGKANYLSSSYPNIKIGFDNVNVRWVLYVFDDTVYSIYENSLVPAGLYPPTTGWTAVDVDSVCNGTLTIDSLSASFCNGATVADLTNTGTALQWYETATGGTALASTTALVTGTYYASQTVNGCESTRTALSITVNTVPSAPTVISPQVYAGNATIASLTATGTNLQWYAAATGGTALASTEALVDGTTYYVSQTGTCGESPRAAVLVRKISEATQTLCAPATVANLVSTPSSGTTAQWFTTATGGTALATTTAITTGTYYVEQNTPTTVSTFAGSGTDSETDGTGTAASFNNPRGLAVDVSGNVYVADYGNHKIRKITPSGVVSTFVGSVTQGSTDGIGTAASFNYPRGLAVDASGNVYVADTNNHKIRKITPSGVVSTFVGSVTQGSTDGIGTAASFRYPNEVAVDVSGNVYVADRNNHKIRKITSAGVVSTLAGYGTQGATDGTGTAASFNYPSGVTVDASGNVHVADTNNHKIRKITPAGVVSTLAGSGDAGATDGTGTAASFFNPYGVTVDASGNVYVADKNNNKIRKITPAGEVSTLAGSGTRGATDGTGTAASFYNPYGVTVDASGNVYVADHNNHKIRKITQSSTSNRVAVNVTVNTAPAVSTPVAYNQGDAATALTATGANLLWYTAATGGTGSVTAPTPLTVSVGTTSYWVTQTLNGCESARTEIVVTVNVAAPTTTFATQVYTGDDKDLTDLQVTGSSITWYQAATGGLALPTTTLLVDETTYYASQTIASVESTERLAITVNRISDNTQTFCAPATVANLVSTPSSGTTAQWYETATGGTALASTTALVTGTYYASQTVNGSESTRTALSITVNTTAVPTAISPQVYAGTGTIANLTATGTNLQWYAAATGGTALASTDALVDGTTYYVSQTGTCGESPRAAVTVRKISEATQTFCAPATVANLVSTPSTGATAQWFTTASGGTALVSTDALTTGTYYVEQTTPESIVILGNGFSFPHGVAIQADGKIVVADYNNNAIKRMDADGSNIITLSSAFNGPIGVAVHDGKIVVADYNNNAIKRMDADGSNIITLGNGFNRPSGVAIQANGKIVVADSNNNAIKRMDADGSNIELLGSGISVPTGVAIQADGKIVVADYTNSAIKRMNADGANIITLGSGFSNPSGVAIQADGKILVVDTYNNAIKRMDADGSNIVTLGSGFSNPRGVAIQADGKIVVADFINNAIKQITEASTSNRVAVSITVNTTAVPIVTTPVVYNQGDAATALTATGASLLWYTTATGGTGSVTAPAPSTATVGNTSYWVSSTNANGCESDRVEIVVTVNVAAPTTTFATQVYTGDDKDLTDLQVTGSSITWYQAATGGSDLPTTTLLVDETTYYASQTIASVESTERLAITVNRISDNTQMLPAASTVANLVATPSTGATAQWFTAATGGTALPSTDVLTNGVYYVEQNTPSSTVTLGSGFYGPSDVAIQADGKIVVADTGNNAIKRITESLSSNRVPVNVDVTTLSVSNFETNGIAIYPNPSTGIFNISAQENVTIEVYDLVGKQIKTQEVPVGTSTIDISNYASGVYLLKATNTKGAVNNYKLIKQ